MMEDVTIEITEDEVRVGDYYLRGRIPDKLAWVILALLLTAVGISYDDLTVFAGSL